MKTINSLKFVFYVMLVFTALLNMSAFREIREDPCQTCPRVINIDPDHGIGGDIIEIIGVNISEFIPGIDKVTINGKEALLVESPNETDAEVLVQEYTLSGPVMERPLFSYDNIRVEPIEPVEVRKREVVPVQGRLSSSFVEQNSVLFDDGLTGRVTVSNQVILKVRVPKGTGTGPLSIIVDGLMVEGPVFTYDYISSESTSLGDNIGFVDMSERQKLSIRINNIPSGKNCALYTTDFSNPQMQKTIKNVEALTSAGPFNSGGSREHGPENSLTKYCYHCRSKGGLHSS